MIKPEVSHNVYKRYQFVDQGGRIAALEPKRHVLYCVELQYFGLVYIQNHSMQNLIPLQQIQQHHRHSQNVATNPRLQTVHLQVLGSSVQIGFHYHFQVIHNLSSSI